MNGVIFGAPVLAAATRTTGGQLRIAAVRLGDHALAVGDIFGWRMRLGPDSLVALAVFALGIAALFALPH